ncbi:MAG: hypothetical protein ACLFU8_17240 [Anaerolineales bacterium]
MDGEQVVETAYRVGDLVRERHGWNVYRVLAFSQNGRVAYVLTTTGTPGTYNYAVEDLILYENPEEHHGAAH